jgi:hypothetical protein
VPCDVDGRRGARSGARFGEHRREHDDVLGHAKTVHVRCSPRRAMADSALRRHAIDGVLLIVAELIAGHDL